MRKIVLCLCLFLLLPFASSFGVTPAQRIFDYQPGTEQKYSFEVMNSESKNINLKIVSKGELNGSVTLSTQSILFTPDISSVRVEYTVRVPAGLAPGRHIADILVVETEGASGEETYIGAIVGIVTKVVIDVPYPGKYLESALSIDNRKNGEVVFTIPVVSKGELDIENARAKIDILSPDGKKVTSISTNEVSVPSLERRELYAALDTSAIASGTYQAVAKVSYDKSSLDLEKEFFVGTGGLSIKNIAVDTKDFKLGGIAKFEFLVENKLNIPAEEVYVLMQVFDSGGKAFSESKSATYDIDAFGSKEVVAFWDTEDVKAGKYDTKVFIYSAQEPIEAQLTLDVSENNIIIIGTGYAISSSKGGSSLVTILIIVIVVLVLLNLVWFLVLRRKIKTK